nr:glycosyltransferase [Gammaproteobacteria bacterium]
MVSDYEPNCIKSWECEEALIHSLAAQDISESFEVILVESEENIDQPIPVEISQLLPDLKVIYHPSAKSAVLKDFGVSQSKGRYVAVIESDCIPSENWLRLLLAALTSNEDYVVSSGRTFYGDDTPYHRILNVLHRSWDDLGKSGRTSRISNNGAIYQREILEKFMYPDSATPYLSAELRNRQIQKAGYQFYFERNATMKHAIGGLHFIWDFQRNKGHQSISVNRNHNIIIMPFLLLKKVYRDFNNSFRIGK